MATSVKTLPANVRVCLCCGWGCFKENVCVIGAFMLTEEFKCHLVIRLLRFSPDFLFPLSFLKT